MSESLEELKAIRDGAPKKATHHYFISPDEYRISSYIDMDNCNWWDSVLCQWKSWGGVADGTIRSLSDIKRIIELMEYVKDLKANTVNFNGGVECSDIPNNLAM